MDLPTRDQAIATLRDDHHAQEALIGRLDDDQLTRPATIGGDWSAKDLLGHIAFWEELALETIADWRAGRRPAVEQFAEAGQEAVDRANADNQARTVAQSLAETRARAAASHAAVVQAIGSLSDDEWWSTLSYPGARRATLGELLGNVLGATDHPFGHAYEYLPDRRVWFGDTVDELKRDVGASLENRYAALAIPHAALNRCLAPGLALAGLRAAAPPP